MTLSLRYSRIRFGGPHTDILYLVTLDEFRQLVLEEQVPDFLELHLLAMLATDYSLFLEFAKENATYFGQIGKVSVYGHAATVDRLFQACPPIRERVDSITAMGDLSSLPDFMPPNVKSVHCTSPVAVPDSVTELGFLVFGTGTLVPPRNLESLQIRNANGVWWTFVLPEHLQILKLSYCDDLEKALQTLALPGTLHTLELHLTVPLADPRGLIGKLPPFLKKLVLDIPLQPVEMKFPPLLESLRLDANETCAGLMFPGTLKSLDLLKSSISTLEGAQLPTTLEKLDISFTRLTSVAGLRLPNLKELNACGSPIGDWCSLQWGNVEDVSIDEFCESVEKLNFPLLLKSLDLHFSRPTDLAQLRLPHTLKELQVLPVTMDSPWVAPPQLEVCRLSGKLGVLRFTDGLKELLLDPESNEWTGPIPASVRKLSIPQPLRRGQYPPNLEDLYIGSCPEDLAQLKLPESLLVLNLGSTSEINAHQWVAPPKLQKLICAFEDQPNLPPTVRVYQNHMEDGSSYDSKYAVPLVLLDVA